MIFTESVLKGSYVIDLTPLADDRGWFARTFCKNEFAAIGHTKEWVQMNHSFTKNKGSIRGMHFQMDPFKECKLVRCISGVVFDVIIDLRKDSPTFLQWFGVELSAANRKMIYIPEGFAHGFQTLSDNCELVYNHTQFYTKEAEGGVRYNDEKINIQWPLPLFDISERDNTHPKLDDNFKGI
ncbi:dTDP-4-dehydrorhamnose 3,5-epimerase [Ferruginibacter lapsinanis]|uniref:dTDP-4-dehydrorhamnose 3,5-epimerase n=1 Tax=Ferruginibacter lapsinanis TaxID=563172 RepID=UPI001E3E6500|nr:dTDP-4-dehydrorhamnose 3,5-epimerase [Ferruginibacter lapsinanis]UEG49048.1 dTDP-4-dehydrorhamnose 3,5-epimerase [Ferruginibacter lapsinanis]